MNAESAEQFYFLCFSRAFSRLFWLKFKASSATLLRHMKTKTNTCNAYFRRENHVDSDKMAKLSTQAKKPSKTASETKNGNTKKDDSPKGKFVRPLLQLNKGMRFSSNFSSNTMSF